MLNDNENHIFKFMPFNVNTLKALIKGELWFGKPHNLNDPFESKFNLIFEGQLPDDNFLKDYYIKELGINHALIERIQRNKINVNFLLRDIEKSTQNKIMSDVGICSFSLIYNDTKMWSHYADSHKGICLVFDRGILDASLGININHQAIEYCKELPEVKVIAKKSQLRLKGDNLQRIINCKLTEWESEQELRYSTRFYNSNARRAIPYDQKALQGIIFGENINNDDAGTLFHLLHKNKEIFWAKATKDFGSGKMDIIYTNPLIHNGYNNVVF